MPQLRIRRPGSRGSRGQSLVEFALVLPVLLLLTLIAIDFGRVYLGWVNLQNMARIAANYAANNPTAWVTNNTSIKTAYQNQIRADAKQNNCGLPMIGGVQTAPDPVFSPDTKIGSTAQVGLNCTFKILTPIIGNVVGTGGNLTISASSTFPIKNGMFAAGGGGPVVPVAPVAAFAGYPTSIVEGASVQFTDTSTGPPTSWAWDFGDGVTDVAKDPIHSYSTAGLYTVALTVSNSIGTDTRTRIEYINVTVAPPNANFTASPLSGDKPLKVDFTDTSIGSPTTWAWDFGDGGTSAAQNPTYTYMTAGTYTVSLSVTSASGGGSVTKSGYIAVGVGSCTVPSFAGFSTSVAQSMWGAGGAGFTTIVNFRQGNLPWIIASQSLVGASSVPCNSSITVSKN